MREPLFRKPKSIGMPFHGEYKADQAYKWYQPNGSQYVDEYPWGGEFDNLIGIRQWRLKHPNAPFGTRSIDEQAADLLKERKYLDYTYLVGKEDGNYVNGERLGIDSVIKDYAVDTKYNCSDLILFKGDVVTETLTAPTLSESWNLLQTTDQIKIGSSVTVTNSAGSVTYDGVYKESDATGGTDYLIGCKGIYIRYTGDITAGQTLKVTYRKRQINRLYRAGNTGVSGSTAATFTANGANVTDNEITWVDLGFYTGMNTWLYCSSVDNTVWLMSAIIEADDANQQITVNVYLVSEYGRIGGNYPVVNRLLDSTTFDVKYSKRINQWLIDNPDYEPNDCLYQAGIENTTNFDNHSIEVNEDGSECHIHILSDRNARLYSPIADEESVFCWDTTGMMHERADNKAGAKWLVAIVPVTLAGIPVLEKPNATQEINVTNLLIDPWSFSLIEPLDAARPRYVYDADRVYKEGVDYEYHEQDLRALVDGDLQGKTVTVDYEKEFTTTTHGTGITGNLGAVRTVEQLTSAYNVDYNNEEVEYSSDSWVVDNTTPVYDDPPNDDVIIGFTGTREFHTVSASGTDYPYIDIDLWQILRSFCKNGTFVDLKYQYTETGSKGNYSNFHRYELQTFNGLGTPSAYNFYCVTDIIKNYHNTTVTHKLFVDSDILTVTYNATGDYQKTGFGANLLGISGCAESEYNTWSSVVDGWTPTNTDEYNRLKVAPYCVYGGIAGLSFTIQHATLNTGVDIDYWTHRLTPANDQIRVPATGQLTNTSHSLSDPLDNWHYVLTFAHLEPATLADKTVLHQHF